MPSDTCILSWLEHLWQLYPAQGVLVVGAGNGTSPWIDALQRWNAPSVTLVEADDAQFQHLQRNMPEREGWQLRKQVVAAETGRVTYYHASSTAESGLVEPENLRALWPNLKTRQKSTRQAISLADLLSVIEPKANWLLLDCLPAGALLAGADPALATCDVIVTRALLSDEAGAELPAVQADASTITQLLQAQGFCTVATQISRHPGIAHTLHVRDRATRIAQLEVQIDILEAELTRARDTEIKSKQTEAAAKADALKQNAAEVKARNELKKQLDESNQRLAAIETENQEMGYQQKLLHAEVEKAESKVDLIKKILLRDIEG